MILRSGALRHLHDLALAFALGADGVVPWLLLDLAGSGGPRLQEAIGKGLEKVISTMGTHELRGYGRAFCTIGVGPELADLLGVRDFAGSGRAGLTLEGLETEARRRAVLACDAGPVRARRERRFFPQIWKVAGQVAAGLAPYAAYAARVREAEKSGPVALRQLLDLAPAGRPPLRPSEVDTRVDIHEFPIAISAMSFGSQGETAFRSYLEAARRLNMVCTNGEGGEIADLLGRYRRHRGQQVASGRFGVSSEMLNSAYVIEIKIGQGAKPGEGGHLPGKKVSAKVARARNATLGVDLISPSNNHDIYSIEDLAQLVEELKRVNPFAKVSVKVPVVPNIGTIAVGIAKAGADIVTLSGFDGGTGAARMHALEHVGLPVEIGVVEAHRALSLAGLRHLVEIWADGGLKTGRDIVRMLLLGANRCGFGTLAMVAAGCTICRACQTDTCHVGIATQIEDEREAAEKGLERFVAREFDTAVAHLCAFFGAMGEEIRELTAQLGFRRTQDLVGHAELLAQVAAHDRVDLAAFLAPLPVMPGLLEAARDPVRRARERRLRRHLARLPILGRDAGAPIPATAAGAGGADVLDGFRQDARRALGTGEGGEAVCWRLYGARHADRPHAPGEFHGHVLARAPVAQPRPRDPGRHDPVRIRGEVAGNGCGAFGTADLDLRIEGGAQDGAAKCATGGKLVILKGLAGGGRLDGAVGKGFGYGAQRGTFYVQGVADSRFCIRLSGARVVAGARLDAPIDDSAGPLAARAQLKGFAFEYMTSGVAVVLGDPGPWCCAGMTGGSVFVKLWPQLGLDEAALARRVARGSGVRIRPAGPGDGDAISALLEAYRAELAASGQAAEAAAIAAIIREGPAGFAAIQPAHQQVDQAVSTE